MARCVPLLRGLLMIVGLVSLTCAFALGNRLPVARADVTTTTINFDDLPAGTSVTNQYDAQGVDFSSGLHPLIAQVDPSLAASGDQVARIDQCPGCEFYTPSAIGILSTSASSVQVDVGYFANSAAPGNTATISIQGFDADGNSVGPAGSATVTEGQGFRTQVSVASSTNNIAKFVISAGQGDDNKELAIDDLSFEVDAGSPPDFSLAPTDSLTDVRQGASASDTITVNRINGSTGSISLTASGLPNGVTASFDPNPADTTSTMTLQAATDAALTSGNPQNVTVTGTPSSASAGSSARSTTVGVTVVPNFIIQPEDGTISMPPCSTVQVPIDVVYAHGFQGDVDLSAAGASGNVRASVSPSSVGPPTDGGFVSKAALLLTRSGSDNSTPVQGATFMTPGDVRGRKMLAKRGAASGNHQLYFRTSWCR